MSERSCEPASRLCCRTVSARQHRKGEAALLPRDQIGRGFGVTATPPRAVDKAVFPQICRGYRPWGTERVLRVRTKPAEIAPCSGAALEAEDALGDVVENGRASVKLSLASCDVPGASEVTPQARVVNGFGNERCR